MASINRHSRFEGWLKVAVVAVPLLVGSTAAIIFPGVQPQAKIEAPVGGSVTIENPCSTFVSEFAPLETPLLRSAGGELELVLSFTPAKDKEAELVIEAVSAGNKTLSVKNGQQQIKALRIEQRRLVLSVSSAVEAEKVLELLCFEEKYRNPKLKSAL